MVQNESHGQISLEVMVNKVNANKSVTALLQNSHSLWEEAVPQSGAPALKPPQPPA